MLHSCQPLLGKTVRQPLADSICSLIYIDFLTFTFILTLPEFIYSVPLCDRDLLWFTQYSFSSPYLRCPDIAAGKEREGERNRGRGRGKRRREGGRERERMNDNMAHIFSSLLLWETKSVIIFVQWNMNRNLIEFLKRFCFLDIDIALSSFCPFLLHSWNFLMVSRTRAATFQH